MSAQPDALESRPFALLCLHGWQCQVATHTDAMRLHTLRRLQAIACVALVAVGALLVAVQGLRIERNVDDSLLPDVSETAGGDGALPVWKFFPPLWSRPRLRSRVLVPDASPPHMDRLQPSYACDLFDDSDGTGCEPPSVADSTPSPRVGIAYGGVLQRRKRVAVNSTGVVRAMEWAVQRAAAMAADDVAAAAAQHCEQTTVASPTGKDTDSGEQGPSPDAMELKSWTIEVGGDECVVVMFGGARTLNAVVTSLPAERVGDGARVHR